MTDPAKIAEYLDAEEALRVAREHADHYNENYEHFSDTGGKYGLDPNDPYNQKHEDLAFKEYDAAGKRHNAASASLRFEPTGAVLGDARFGPEVDAERSRRARPIDIPDIFNERGFVGNIGPAPSPEVQAGILNPRQAAAKAALKGLGGGALGLGTDWMMAYSEGARDVDDWMSQEEESITQMIPGLVSPSELPPPAVLSDERMQAVTATQGTVGMGPDFESAPVTDQEVRAFISNRMAQGRPLPPWAEAITSRGPDGRTRIEPRVLRRPPQRPMAPPPAAPQQSSVPMELRRR